MDTKGLIALARLIRDLDGVQGRTRLQKIVHLLGQQFQNDFRQEFTLHYFGPYSQDLAAEINFLVSAKILHEEPPANNEAPYEYKIADDRARQRIDAAGGTGEAKWLSLARRLNTERKKDSLEALSTFVFLHRKCVGNDRESLRSEFVRIKPHLQPLFDEAVALSRELRLVPSESN